MKQEITAFKPEFIKKKEKEWKSFVKTLNQEDPPSLSDVIAFLKSFLLLIIKTLTLKKSLPKHWKASRSWEN